MTTKKEPSIPGTTEDDDKIREEAKLIYALPSSDDIEIDANATISRSDHGSWVQAWVWVPHDETEEDGNDGN